MIHVAIIHKRYLDAILAGEKTIEARLARNRCEPFARIQRGERIYFKQSSGPFRATALAAKVTFRDSLCPNDVKVIRDRYGDRIRADRAYWKLKEPATCATLIWLRDIEPIDSGPDLSAAQTPGSRRAWFVLANDLGVYPQCTRNCQVLPNLDPVPAARG